MSWFEMRSHGPVPFSGTVSQLKKQQVPRGEGGPLRRRAPRVPRVSAGYMPSNSLGEPDVKGGGILEDDHFPFAGSRENWWEGTVWFLRPILAR